MKLSNFFNQISFITILTKCTITSAFLIAAFTLNGDWIIIVAHLMKQYGILDYHCDFGEIVTGPAFRNLSHFWVPTMITGFGIYFVLGISFHWLYYVRQRDRPEQWKCQPQRWLSKELEWDEIKLGSLSLFVTNTWSAILACYIVNDGYYCAAYYHWLEHGILWWMLQFPCLFIYQEGCTGLELLFYAVAVLHAVTLYVYYHGIISHSGINFKAHWWQPWQPDAVFHDNHHQYFHVNFGFNMTLWDKLHNTYRKPDRIYRENIFYGQGKSFEEITKEELEEELHERETESKTAYPTGHNPYLLSNTTAILKGN